MPAPSTARASRTGRDATSELADLLGERGRPTVAGLSKVFPEVVSAHRGEIASIFSRSTESRMAIREVAELLRGDPRVTALVGPGESGKDQALIFVLIGFAWGVGFGLWLAWKVWG